MQHAVLDRIAVRVVESSARGDDLSPDAALFLLRRYVASPDDEVGGALGVALARALDAAAGCADPRACAAWLTLFCDAARIADDERIAAAAGDLAGRLRAGWPLDAASALGMTACAASVDACLRAAGALDLTAIVQPAIDELERAVGTVYRPGHGLALSRPDGDDVAAATRAATGAHLTAASALLTAFEITARVPYAMLAEELIQPARRARDGFGAELDCAAARVLSRLAMLHDDSAYRTAAVVAPDVDYRADAARMLRSHLAEADAGRLADAARYGVALGEFMSASGPDGLQYFSGRP